MKCKKGHEDGWTIIDDIIEHTVIDDDDMEIPLTMVLCRCNHLGCKEEEYFNLSISDVSRSFIDKSRKVKK